MEILLVNVPFESSKLSLISAIRSFETMFDISEPSIEFIFGSRFLCFLDICSFIRLSKLLGVSWLLDLFSNSSESTFLLELATAMRSVGAMTEAFFRMP